MSSSGNTTLTIHGGSGRVRKEPMTVKKEAAYTQKLTEAELPGFDVLQKGDQFRC